MAKKWMINAPNGQFVNLSYFGRLVHGQVIQNPEIQKKFPHICVEIFSEPGPTLMEEPAPTMEIIDESPAIENLLNEVPVEQEIIEHPAQEPVVEEEKKNSPGRGKKGKKK